MNLNLLGIDFEDWYHPQLVQPFVKHLKHEPKMFQGLDKIIELLRKTETTATFFMVGELLKSHPSMLDKILENGHEISFHTLNHSNLNDLTKEKFLDELDLDYRLDKTHFIEYTLESFLGELERSNIEIISYHIQWGEIYAVCKGNI
jgi:hypothetical protein